MGYCHPVQPFQFQEFEGGYYGLGVFMHGYDNFERETQ